MTIDQEWLAMVGAALHVPALSAQEQAAILDLVREVAHNVARPAGPLTAYLLGVAVGRGAELGVTAEQLVDLVGGAGDGGRAVASG